MAPRSRHRLVTLATAALAMTMLGGLAGCGAILDADTDEAGGPVGTRAPQPRKTPTPTPETAEAEPTPSATEPTAEDEPAPEAAAPATLSARLLTAAELPGLAGDVGWVEGDTTRQEPGALAGTCHRFEMLSIGAMRVVHRDFTPADGSTGGRANQLVASFADAKTAWRAFEVLKSWQRDCDEALSKFDHHEVGAPQKVDVDAGEAHWYLLTYGPAEGESGSEYLDAEGLALVGNRIAVLRIVVVGQDHEHPAGDEPMVDAVRAAAAKLR